MAQIAMRYGQAGKRAEEAGTSWKLLGKTTLTVSTTSTSAATAGSITLPQAWTKSKIIYVRIRGQAGKRAGYFYGHDAYFTNLNIANGSTSSLSTAARMIYAYTSDGKWYEYSSSYGVYGYSISSAGVVTIRRRYNSTYSLTINDTFDVEVWALDFTDGKSPFDA